MSDTTPRPHPVPGMIPDATVFDPASETATPLADGPGGTVVLLLVSTPDLEWAAETAVELSTRWARSGQRIVLADLSLEQPILHERVGVPNLEGLVDIFLYGASLARSAKLLRPRGFYLIPAGTYTPDTHVVFQHPRWSKLVAGFRDANASLLLFLPADTAGLEEVSRFATGIVALGDPRDAPLAGAIAEELPIHAVLVPPRAADRVPVEGTARAAAAPVVISSKLVGADDEELVLPPPPVREPRPKRPALALLALLALAVLVLALLGFLLARTQPGLLPWASAPAAAADDSLGTDAAVVPLPVPPTPAGEPLPYSVQVKAFTSLAAAREQLALEQARVEDAAFLISPEIDDEILYFKILSGVLPDTVAASRLRERLVSTGAVDEEDAMGSWSLIRHTPLSFEVGEYASREAAVAAADSLLAREIFAYPVAVPYSDGSERWRLYAGAFRDSASATAMHEALSRAGLPIRLVPRVGIPPAAADGG